MSKYLGLVLVVLLAGGAWARHINEEGLNLIKSFEGFRANFYHDAVGVKTIGYGHACHVSDCSKIHPPLTVKTATELLRHDIGSYENCVNAIGPKLNEHQFAALVSFVYNLGCGTLQHSTLGKDIKAHKYKAAAGQFGLYVHAGGRVLAGLVRRRKTERALFCKGGGC